MKYIYDFSLQEVWGFDSMTDLTCHVEIEDEDIDCSIPLSDDFAEQTLEIPSQGVFQLRVERNHTLLGGVKLDLASAEPQMKVPLFTDPNTWWNSDSESFASLLLDFAAKECLSTVTEEDTENSFYFANEDCKHFEVLSKELSEKNKSLREKILELEQSLSHSKWEHHQQIRHLKHVHYEENALAALLVDKLKYEANSYKVVKDDLENQCRGVETLFKQEKYQREHLEKQLQGLTGELEPLLAEHKQRETVLTAEVAEASETLTQLRARLASVEEELRSVHSENASLKEKLLIAEAHKLGSSSELHGRYQFLLDKFEDSERQRQLLHEQFEAYRNTNQKEMEVILQERETESMRAFKEETSMLKEQLTSQQEVIADLENKLEELELDTYTKQQDQHSDYQRQITALNRKVTRKTEDLETLKQHSEQQQQQLMDSRREVATLTDQVKHLSKKLETAAKDSFEWRRKLKEAEDTNSSLGYITQHAKHAADERVKRQQEKYEELIRELKEREEALKLELKQVQQREEHKHQELIKEHKKILQSMQQHLRLERHKPEEDFPKRESAKQWSDNADERFNQYLRNYGVENEFVRVAEGVYTFGSKKVSVSIKNGSLVCRVGGGYMMIDEFLRLFIKREADPLSPKNESELQLDSEEEIVYEYATHLMNGFKENKDISPMKPRVPKHQFKSFKPMRQSRDWSATPVKRSGSGRRLSQGVL